MRVVTLTVGKDPAFEVESEMRFIGVRFALSRADSMARRGWTEQALELTYQRQIRRSIQPMQPRRKQRGLMGKLTLL